MEESEKRERGWGEKLKVRSLGASYFLLKKIKGIGTPLTPDVEYLHIPTQDHHWNESYYFNFTDPKRIVGGWTRIGILPNQESDIGAMMLYAGGSRILATYHGDRAVCEDDSITMGDLAYKRVEPLNKWRLTFTGTMADVDDSRRLPELSLENIRLQEVEVDLEFEGVAPCFDFKDADPRAMGEMLADARTHLKDLRKVSKVSSEHYEQVGRVNGSIRIGNREIAFQGSGHRDHSWGPRDWAAPRLWTWLTCQFGEELAFNLSRVAIASVDFLSGFICRDGANYPLRRAHLYTEFEEDGIIQRRLSFRLEDTGGRVIDVNGEALTVIPLQLESDGHITQVNEALTEYSCEGMVGYGISEYLHQLGEKEA